MPSKEVPIPVSSSDILQLHVEQVFDVPLISGQSASGMHNSTKEIMKDVLHHDATLQQYALHVPNDNPDGEQQMAILDGAQQLLVSDGEQQLDVSNGENQMTKNAGDNCDVQVSEK